MTTRVELTARAARSDIFNEVKTPRTHVSPLSDASNKSSESSISNSLIIEDTMMTGVPSKPVSMFSPGVRPRLSPKPFSREKTAENTRSFGIFSSLSADVKPYNDVPCQASTTISLSATAKTEENERVGRKVFTSSQPSPEEYQINKSEVFSPTAFSRRQSTSRWVSRIPDINDPKSTLPSEDCKVLSKPPIISRKPEISQQQENVQASFSRISSSDEQKESSLNRAKHSSLNPEWIDSSSVRAQLRPKRRPVSAMFLDSINDQPNDKVVETEKTWNRRPLSEDLTSLFESKGFGNKKEIPSEETKENRPLRTNARKSSITENQQPDLENIEEDFTSNKSTHNDTRAGAVISMVSTSNTYSSNIGKNTGKEISAREQEITDIAENEGIVKVSAIDTKQPSKSLSGNSSTSEVKNADEPGIAPGMTKRRISLYRASSNTSVDATEVPTNIDKNTSTPNTERKSRAFVYDKDLNFRVETTSQSQPSTLDFSKKFGASPVNLEQRSEKTTIDKIVSVLQKTGSEKEKKDLKTHEALEEKQLRPRRSFRRFNEPLQVEDSTSEKKSYVYQAHSKSDVTEEREKNSLQMEKPMRTVKANMFEHKVEWHSTAEVYSVEDPAHSQPSGRDVSSASLGAKPESSKWLDWLSSDNVQVSQRSKDLNVSDTRSSERKVGKATSFTDTSNDRIDVPQSLKKIDNRCVEPRFEVIQTIGERVSSETIHIAAEDKAVTLRSRRSFHRKEREQDKAEADDGFLDRPTNLQRSKSEYKKRITQDTSHTSGDIFSRNFDYPLDRKNALRAEKRQLGKTPIESSYKNEMSYLSSRNKNIGDISISDFQVKSQKEGSAQAKIEGSLEHCGFGISTMNSKENKRSGTDFNVPTYKSFSNSADTDSERRFKSVKDEPTVTISTVSEGIKKPAQVQEFGKQSYQSNRFSSENEPVLSLKKMDKDDSNDFISVMLNQEVEQIKKDLTVHPSTRETDTILTIIPTNTEDRKWVRRKASFHDVDTSNNDTGKTSDMLPFEHAEMRRKQIDLRFKTENNEKTDIFSVKNASPVKVTSPVDSKATYFALTCIDNNKQKDDSGSEELYLKRNLRTSTAHSKTPFTQEEAKTHEDLETSVVLKESKSYTPKILKGYTVGKTEKISERQNVIDIDALLRKHQKPNPEDTSFFHMGDDVRATHNTHEMDKKNTQENYQNGSFYNIDGSYKSKVVDIDSLMADYNACQQKDKEKMFTDDDHNFSNWERSRSFKDSDSKTSTTKWKDPSVKHFTFEGYHYESVSARYSSRETTSTKDDLKHEQPKSTDIMDNIHSVTEASRWKNTDEVRDDQGIQGHPEKSSNVTLESLLEFSPRAQNYKTPSTQAVQSPGITEGMSTLILAKNTPVESKMDDNDEDSMFVSKIEYGSSWKSISTEYRQLPDGRKPAKASDLIGLMLQNKDRRMEQHRSRQNTRMELLQEPKTQRSKSQQEQTWRKIKEYSEKEHKPYSTPSWEQAGVSDLHRRKSQNHQREHVTKSDEDHVKQCFSRSSTANKDTDSLVQEPDRQYGTWVQDKHQTADSLVHESSSYDNISSRRQQSQSRLSSLSHTETDQHDSITEAREGSLDRSSMDLDSTDGTESTPSFHEARSGDFSFMDQTSVLDSTALKNRVQLGRKSQRRAPSQLQRRSRLLQASSQLAVIEDTDNHWMYTDSTEETTEKKEEEEEETEEHVKPQRSSIHSQRMPVFPGMDHSTLVAQLRKRQDVESSSEASTQPTRSPKSPLPQGTLGVKLLPTSADKQDSAAVESPQWLKELKSKKRLSQYENHS